MIIGILSDTHGRLPAATAGVNALLAAGAEFLIHCGDVGGEPVLDLLAGTPAAFVFGNNDFDRDELARYARSIDVGCYGSFADLQLGGKRLAVTHGDDPALMRRVRAGRQHDYLLHGHTHVPRDDREGPLRILNPGALHRAARKSVAILDTDRDAFRLIPIDL